MIAFYMKLVFFCKNEFFSFIAQLFIFNVVWLQAGVLCIMVCLKIMVANSRPWWVNSTYCRLVRPLSSRL